MKTVAVHNSPLAFDMRERVFMKDALVYDSGWWSPNTLTNEGQAHMLNVWAREQPNLDKYLMLLDMPGLDSPDKTTVYADLNESTTPGTDGYDRQQIDPSDWGAPVLDSGDMRIAAAQKTFGTFTGNVPVSHVGMISTSTGTGTFFLFISTAYHSTYNISNVFVEGMAYQITIRDKQT